MVAEHPRCMGRGQTIYDPWHYVPVLARKPGALRNGALFKDWLLPSNLERVRRKLRGADDGDRQMVKVLAAVLTDGLASVDAACAEALGQGVHSADVIINILARRKDPGAPVTIMTPDALKLHHAPLADCARYDSLRRNTRHRHFLGTLTLGADEIPGRGSGAVRYNPTRALDSPRMRGHAGIDHPSTPMCSPRCDNWFCRRAARRGIRSKILVLSPSRTDGRTGPRALLSAAFDRPRAGAQDQPRQGV